MFCTSSKNNLRNICYLGRSAVTSAFRILADVLNFSNTLNTIRLSFEYITLIKHCTYLNMIIGKGNFKVEINNYNICSYHFH